ncbi:MULTISPECIES: hypothetical protein [Paenibacillaceae]|uniref:hypothetical protein n=1 Tax=Paenibacillaceae TaxID=186822 RepID=UPI00159EC87E|nr:hypothetical protein [Paenibacillus hemerocallicola]
MDFTEGKRRKYERLMKEKPGFTNSEPSEEEERPPRKQAQSVGTVPKKPERKRSRGD